VNNVITVPNTIKIGGHLFRIIANRNLDSEGKRAVIVTKD